MPRKPKPPAIPNDVLDHLPATPEGRVGFSTGWRTAYTRPAVAARMVNEDAEASSPLLRAKLAGRALGAAHGLAKRARCQKCGRELRDPLSVARNVGPDCWEQGYRATLVDGTEALS